MSDHKRFCAIAAEHNPQMILWDGFENAFIGFAERCGQPTLAVYDHPKMMAVLMERDGLTEEEAFEYISYNVTGGWLGEHTPVCLIRDEEIDGIVGRL